MTFDLYYSQISQLNIQKRIDLKKYLSKTEAVARSSSNNKKDLTQSKIQ